MNTSQKTQHHQVNPLISIVVPIYNTEKYLSRCLDSIVNQTYNNLEIILIDDGSTDKSFNIIQNYAKKDPRIKYLQQNNSGQSSARNHGIKLAKGDYVSFVDSDDEIHQDFIKNLLEPYLSHPDTSIAICGMNYKRLKTNSNKNVYINSLRPCRHNESQKAYILYLLTIDGRMYSSVNKLYKTQIVKKISFDESINFAEDTKYVLDYLSKSSGDVAFILKPLYIYNFGTETSTVNSSATIWKNWQQSYQNLKKWVGKNPTPQETFWLRMVHLRWRISYLRSKHRAKQ